MTKFEKIFSTLWLLLALTACAKEEPESIAPIENPMLFSIKEIIQTKVSYDDQTNGGLSAEFDHGDQIGLYAYYNNYYDYYDEYGNFAESVIFANNGAHVNSSGSITYNPIQSWTFSSVYGTSPFTLDCVAYYPFKAGYNDNYAHMTSSLKGAATINYDYAYQESVTDEKTDVTTTTIKVHDKIDFMTAHTKLSGVTEVGGDGDEWTAAEFREKMLALPSIKLSFMRQLATLNFKVSKPDNYANKIEVTKVEVTFDAPTKYAKLVSDNSGTDPWSTMASEWDNGATPYPLTASRECSKELKETGWDDVPTAGAVHPAENLLDCSNDDDEDNNKLFYFPPKTKIWKVVFTINETDATTNAKVEKTFTWHAHVAEIKANTHYSLTLELDPNRAN